MEESEKIVYLGKISRALAPGASVETFVDGSVFGGASGVVIPCLVKECSDGQARVVAADGPHTGVEKLVPEESVVVVDQKQILDAQKHLF